jgi:hypothetical protein
MNSLLLYGVSPRNAAGQAIQKGKDGTESADETELKKRAQTLRVMLERLRLLAELVAKREKMKREDWKLRKQIFQHQVLRCGGGGWSHAVEIKWRVPYWLFF